MAKVCIVSYCSMLFGLVSTTIDINLSEFNYLADHLTSSECRKLVAALHYQSYNKPNALDAAERKIPEDITCLRLLLHWNSAKGEGSGETHEIVLQRLRQIGRVDLANWLGKTVFQQLGKDLSQDLHESLHDFITETSESFAMITDKQLEEESDWIPLDTVCWVIILALGIGTFGLLATIFIGILKRRFKKEKKKQIEYKEYRALEQVVSESESEDKFDVRKAEPRGGSSARFT